MLGIPDKPTMLRADVLGPELDDDDRRQHFAGTVIARLAYLSAIEEGSWERFGETGDLTELNEAIACLNERCSLLGCWAVNKLTDSVN